MDAGSPHAVAGSPSLGRPGESGRKAGRCGASFHAEHDAIRIPEAEVPGGRSGRTMHCGLRTGTGGPFLAGLQLAPQEGRRPSSSPGGTRLDLHLNSFSASSEQVDVDGRGLQLSNRGERSSARAQLDLGQFVERPSPPAVAFRTERAGFRMSVDRPEVRKLHGERRGPPSFPRTRLSQKAAGRAARPTSCHSRGSGNPVMVRV
jgi:hypothetical protein